MCKVYLNLRIKKRKCKDEQIELTPNRSYTHRLGRRALVSILVSLFTLLASNKALLLFVHLQSKSACLLCRHAAVTLAILGGYPLQLEPSQL